MDRDKRKEIKWIATKDKTRPGCFSDTEWEEN